MTYVARERDPCIVFFSFLGKNFFAVRKMNPSLCEDGIEGLALEMMAKEMVKFDQFMDKRELTILDEKKFDSDESPWLLRTGWREHLSGLFKKTI